MFWIKCLTLKILKPQEHLPEFFLYRLLAVVVKHVVSPFFCLVTGHLAVHSLANLLLRACVPVHCPLQAGRLVRIDQYRLIDLRLESRLKQNGTFHETEGCRLAFCPSAEIFPHGRVYDGIDMCRILTVGKQILRHGLFVQIPLTVVCVRSDEPDEFPANFPAIPHQPFGRFVTVVNRIASPGNVLTDKRLPASDTSRNAYPHHPTQTLAPVRIQSARAIFSHG